MVKNIYNTIVKNIIREKGDITLFAVFAIDNLSESLTIILSADWINDENVRDSFKYLLDLLRNNLDREDLSKITRIGVYSPEEHPIELFKIYKVNEKITNEKINGFEIKEGLIVYSNFK